jgi:hypothetical protein
LDSHVDLLLEKSIYNLTDVPVEPQYKASRNFFDPQRPNPEVVILLVIKSRYDRVVVPQYSLLHPLFKENHRVFNTRLIIKKWRKVRWKKAASRAISKSPRNDRDFVLQYPGSHFSHRTGFSQHEETGSESERRSCK